VNQPNVRPKQRDALAASTDARAIRTRQRLIDAFGRLMDQDETELSVASLTGEAGVTRAAFYSHFADIEELAIHLVVGVFSDIQADDVSLRLDHSLSATGATRATLHRLLEHVHDHRALYSWVLLKGSARTRRAVADHFAGFSQATLDSAGLLPGHLDSRLLATYLAGGFVHVLTRYLEGSLEVDAVALEDHLVALTPWVFLDRPV
jgi:AcrR family transcriptional regulator